jgi:GAF domain-containing protein
MPLPRVVPFPTLPTDVLMVRAAREQAAEQRLGLWCERLGDAQSKKDASAVLECGLDAAMSMTSSDLANIQVLDRRQRLIMSGHRRFSDSFLEFFEVVSDRHTACGVALEERRSIVVQDIVTSPIYSREVLEVLLDDGVRGVCSAPLLSDRGRVFGVLSVHYRQPHFLNGSDLARFEKLARFVGELVTSRFPRLLK